MNMHLYLVEEVNCSFRNYPVEQATDRELKKLQLHVNIVVSVIFEFMEFSLL
jgi:hypothetical protein